MRSLQFLEFSFWEARNTKTRLSTLRNKFRASKSFYINRSLQKREVLAVSDGELNSADLDGRGSDQSLNSLPSVQNTGLGSERSVASWAVSFERLLQDPFGVEYFTEFLKKEYSAENIHFWKSCEKYQSIPADDTEQLMQESRQIYNEYLSSTSLCPVNVDQQALITEEMLEKPTPNLFKIQQLQIFNLMKFDSYARFVKSPLYQECMMSEVEGRPLPNLSFSPTSLSSGCTAITSGAVKKKKLKLGKSLPLGVETSGLDNIQDGSRANSRSFKRKDGRGNGRDVFDSNGLSSRHESEGSLNSATSLDLSIMSSFSGKSEQDSCSLGSTERDADNKPIKYCCVYFPDGTASLTAVKAGLTIREMLTGVCEKRGYNSSDVKVYLAGNEQKALALDQDCSVLSDQEVKLENRISFELQIEPMNKSLRIVSKPTKSIHEALQSALKKYGLDNQHVVLQRMGESQALDQDAPVTLVAGQSLVLHVHTDVASASGITAEPQTKKEPAKEKHVEIRLPRIDLHHRTQKEAHKDHHTSLVHRRSGITPDKPKFFRHNQDIEGLVEMLNRVQNSRADDQRGLLRKEDLVLPEFLKLPTDEKCHHCQTTCQDAATGMETFPSCPDISTEDCSEKNISAGSTLPSQEAVCCLPSHIENSNAPSYISIDSQDTAVTVADNNMTSLQMGEMCTEEKDDLL
ncbi:regulator of G-protein signaling 14 isoform X5 [Hyla sarda]|uniref:regulator of G-protein signaling 14 isoform X2 n=1 Tax=Hyla sarda TaxID=327740 RepID=UPI0024C2F876|nr:regulator of G-protein signaling 14 isoform X2 [Hyla sarda]XP_056430974.1 regulator of G-protein signaling 14 isoform X5 [Hyla sarda]